MFVLNTLNPYLPTSTISISTERFSSALQTGLYIFPIFIRILIILCSFKTLDFAPTPQFTNPLAWIIYLCIIIAAACSYIVTHITASMSCPEDVMDVSFVSSGNVDYLAAVTLLLMSHNIHIIIIIIVTIIITLLSIHIC